MSGVISNPGDPYPTPDENPATIVRRVFDLPNDPSILFAWNDRLAELTDPYGWDESGGGMSALDTAALMAEVLLESSCPPTGDDGMETIIPHFTLLAAGAYTEFQWVNSYDVLELTMTLATDKVALVDGWVLSLNGTTSGYATSITRVNASGSISADIDNPSSGEFSACITGATGLYRSPVLLRLWREYGAWQGIGHSTLQRSTAEFNHSQFTVYWNSDVDITSLRISPLDGNNLTINSQFMLRGVPA